MEDYKTIQEQLRVEVDKKHYGEVISFLSEVERRKIQSKFCTQYKKLLNAGFHPYDCIKALVKIL
jgi:hypothetical protein|tara:strand:+ start:738 stop:932 length:195 start_codon:yes stop_codon:yes gene_type:complete